MPRAIPFTPSQDIDARRRSAEPVIAGVLTGELVAFCESGVSVVLGVSTVSGQPLVGLGLACHVTSGGKMRVFLREPANVPLLAAVAGGSAVALTFSEPRTHRSIQVKADRARRVELEDDDLERVARQVEYFESELVFINYTPRFAAYYCAYRDEEVVALELSPRQAFVQTPGPGAGEQLG